MPKYHAPFDRVPIDKLKRMAGDSVSANQQATEYVVDGEGVCRAIIGNVEHDPAGNLTGLSGFGLAVLHGDKWVKLLEPVTPGWVELGLENAWVERGESYAPPSYLKDALGFVHLRGMLKGGASPSVAFTLPVGFRPLELEWFPLVGGSFFRGVLVMEPSGAGLMIYEGAEKLFSLSGITFLAEG